MKTIACPNCGKEFTKTSNRQRFCSKNCRVTFVSSYEKVRYQYVSKPKKQYEPAKVKCLRCSRMFDSWDRKLNRICPMCAPYVNDYCNGVNTWVLTTIIY